MVGKFSTSVLNHQSRIKMHLYPSNILYKKAYASGSRDIMAKRSKKDDAAKDNPHQIAAVSRKLNG